MAFLEAGRNNFCSVINKKSWFCAGGKVFRCLPGRKRSQRSPAHRYYGVQFHRRKGNGSPLSCFHRLLRPLVLVAKCSFTLLGVIRESPWEEGLELFGGDVISLCLPGESIYQLPMWCVNTLILNNLPQVKDLSGFNWFFFSWQVNILVTIWEKRVCHVWA